MPYGVKQRPEERLRDRLRRADNGCLEWQGPVDEGYGRIGIAPGRTERAHRLAWTLANGPIPPGMCIRHTCDNRRCCDLNHLLLGTKQQNAQDMVDRDRQAKGERHSYAKLTDQQVREIRELWAAGGKTKKEIGERFGITARNVLSIVRRDTWVHI